MLESELREKLLKAFNLRYKVYFTHGTHERGVDLILKYRDPFLQERRIGLVVKVGDIKCSKAPAAPLYQVINQIMITFENDFEEYGGPLDSIYVVTDGQITPEAKIQIYKAWEHSRCIYFIEGTELKDLFESVPSEILEMVRQEK